MPSPRPAPAIRARSSGLTPLLALLAAAAPLAADGPARADGLHLIYLKLDAVAGTAGTALQVKVESCDPGARALRGQVKRIWRRGPAGGAGAPYAVGQTADFTLPAEPQAVAGKWLAVQTYWETRPARSIRAGQTLVLISPTGGAAEAIEAVLPGDSPRVTRKLDLMFRPGWDRAYVRATPVAALERDLADFDLYELAHAALLARKRLRDAAVLEAAASPAALHHDLVEHHLKALPAPDRPRFLLALARRLRARRAPRLEQLARRHFRDHELRADEVAALAAFLAALDPARRGDAEAIYELHGPLLRYLRGRSGRRDAPRFIDHVARYTPRRPHFGGAEEQVQSFDALLAPAARRAFHLKLMRGLLAARSGAPDNLGLSLVLRGSAGLPRRELLAFLRQILPRIKPEAFDGCHQISAVAREVGRLAGQPGGADAPALQRLAAAVLPRYTCNVEADLKARLQALARPTR